MTTTHPEPTAAAVDHDPRGFITDFDLYLFNEGNHLHVYDKLGSHPESGSRTGVHFAVWAPNSDRVAVIGDFNGWSGAHHVLRPLGSSGIWYGFIPGLTKGERYKYEIRSRLTGALLQKVDPYAFSFEVPPASAAVVWDHGDYQWRDGEWMHDRARWECWFRRPMSIYEAHLGSWRRVPEEGERFLTYRELAHQLVPYVKEMGYTHIELLPVMEHPFAGSWGYQVIGYYAPTSRFGTPEDFKYFIDECHRFGIGVILDWVPGHFPKDAHGLAQFDGTALYEHSDPRQGEHRDWGTLIFNYGRHEVRNFLLSNALYWLKEFHADGLRVDAVASMLYLDYSRHEGEWVPNKYGGRENLDAIDFLRQLNTVTHAEAPGSIMVAEESTAFPAVSRPTYVGGLGFTYKWNMGWMNDILEYVQKDPIYRRFEHRHLTFSLLYAFTENFILPFSHDEVVHGKGPMFDKIPGDMWQKAATLRALYGFMYAHPGKKLLFMGGEFGQTREWSHDRSLDWHLLETGPYHAGLRKYIQTLNWIYCAERALHDVDFDPQGFQWIDCNDNENSVVSFIRKARHAREAVVALLNFTPVPREGYRIGVPEPGLYAEILNSDSDYFGGGNVGNGGAVNTDAIPSHGWQQSLRLTLPPLGCLLLKLQG